MVKAIESMLVMQRASLDKAIKDLEAYQARVDYFEEILDSPDDSRRLSWKENLPKVTP